MRYLCGIIFGIGVLVGASGCSKNTTATGSASTTGGSSASSGSSKNSGSATATGSATEHKHEEKSGDSTKQTAQPATTQGKETAVADNDKPKVKFTTTLGSFVVELDRAKAPKTVANFLDYVEKGHYAGTVFHRVIQDFMIQGGGFDASLKEKASGKPIQNEANNGLKNARGTIAMARTPNPNSATAQFFVNVKDNEFLNFRSETLEGWGYAVFGKVVEGMETIDKIKVVPTGPKGPFQSDVPQKDVVIQTAELVK